MRLVRKIIYFIIFVLILCYIIYYVEPPKSWADASTFQILTIFIPILALATFFFHLFISHLARSFALGLGVMMIAALQALNQLSYLTAGLVILVSLLLFRLIPKRRFQKINNIPNLFSKKK